MSKLLDYREKLNLTQDELAKKTGLSVRTIQRIESGVIPKGHTLKRLSVVLDIPESELKINVSENEIINFQLAKLINLSSIIGIVLPPINILLPFFIIKHKKEINEITKRIISIQILWTIVASVCVLLSPFIRKWFELSNQLTLVLIILSVLVNLYIIIRNTISIDKDQKLSIYLSFSFI
ncbi:helix-turn-helix domain-containing protein [Gillisia marina]|uniref:helix-turn-helix domain-containing protein n=1 Tax=Gillisia marina TaxID=1167637 RepID=UPI00029A06E9|nr:helix-turn-helix domain-containing protein [Gillisia marina]